MAAETMSEPCPPARPKKLASTYGLDTQNVRSDKGATSLLRRMARRDQSLLSLELLATVVALTSPSASSSLARSFAILLMW